MQKHPVSLHKRYALTSSLLQLPIYYTKNGRPERSPELISMQSVASLIQKFHSANGFAILFDSKNINTLNTHCQLHCAGCVNMCCF